MDSVQALLDKYGLQEIYDRLLSAGRRSESDALTTDVKALQERGMQYSP